MTWSNLEYNDMQPRQLNSGYYKTVFLGLIFRWDPIQQVCAPNNFHVSIYTAWLLENINHFILVFSAYVTP